MLEPSATSSTMRRWYASYKHDATHPTPVVLQGAPLQQKPHDANHQTGVKLLCRFVVVCFAARRSSSAPELYYDLNNSRDQFTCPLL